MMILSLLLDRLKDHPFEFFCSSDLDTDINGIKMLTQNQTNFQSDVLYFGSIDLIPNTIDEGEFLNFLAYEPPDLKCEFEFQNNANIIVLNQTIDPYKAYNILQDYFLEEHETSIKIKRMLSALLSNQGLQHLIDEAYEVLKNPIFVVDQSFKYIAKNIGKEKMKSGSLYSTIIRQEIEVGGILEEGIAHIQNTHLDDIVSKSGLPYYSYNEVFQKGTLVSTIRVHHIEVAHIMMIEQYHTFSSIDKECFLRLCYFVAQELQKNSFYKNNKGQMFSYFLIDLLKAEAPSLHNISRRLALLNYKLYDTYYMIVISPQESSTPIKELDVLSQQMHNILIGNIYAIYDHQLVILLNRKKDAGFGEYTKKTLQKYASHNQLKIGISNPFTQITDVKPYYNQAVQSVQFAELLNKSNGLFYYKDFAYLEMLKLCQSHTDLLNFCDPDLMRLLKHDQETSSDLMKTLYCYLEESANSQRTAKKLFIHKNTLHYRLDKIKDILSNPLSSGEDLFKYHLSFRILMYLGLFDLESKS